jgi:hypothetical protein
VVGTDGGRIQVLDRAKPGLPAAKPPAPAEQAVEGDDP